MKLSLSSLPWRALCGAALSGLLLSLAYPRPDFAAAAWVALVPLLLCCDERPFLCGWVCGVVFFGVLLYWLNIVMVTFGGLPPLLSGLCYLLLVAYLALYVGAAVWGSVLLRRCLGLPLTLTFPVSWIACEYLRAILLTGFPWGLLGYSQQSWLTMIQSADLCGVYGLSFLLALVNATLAGCILALRRQTPLPRLAMTATTLLFVFNFGYGWQVLAGNPDQRPRELTTTLVQGNIDQSVKWDPAFQEETVQRYRQLSLSAARSFHPQLIVWPESATPFYFQDQNPLSAEVRKLPTETGAALVFGSPAYEKRADQRWHFLNSAFVLAPSGETLGRSDKVHLVPFGEYVPLKPLLPFVSKLVEGIGDFSPGTLRTVPVDGARIGVLVCYEGIFPDLARNYVSKGSDLLVNLTNDAWYGRSSAPYQHLAMARFRAVENRIWLARAANTGISALISPSGRLNAETTIFETDATTGRVGLGSRPTLYRAIGDLLPQIALVLLSGGLLMLWRQTGWRWRRVR